MEQDIDPTKGKFGVIIDLDEVVIQGRKWGGGRVQSILCGQSYVP